MKKDEFILKAENRIENAIEDEAIATRIGVFGYDTDRMQVGQTLLVGAKELQTKCIREYADVDAAFEVRDTQKELAMGTIKQLRAIGKVAMKSDVAANATLGLNKVMPSTVSGWQQYTESFYTNIIANELWLAKMATFGMTSDKINEGFAQYKAVAESTKTILREKGEAQNATKQRDKAFDDLNEWINDFDIIAKAAMSDEPQLLEKLGIVVKS